MKRIFWQGFINYHIIRSLCYLRFFALPILGKTNCRKSGQGGLRPARLGDAAKLVENLLFNLRYFFFRARAGS